MRNLVTFLTIVWVSSAAADPQFGQIISFAQGVVDNVVKEAAAIVRPLEEMAANLIFSNCQQMKDELNLNVEAYADNEPDLSQLTLNYYSQGVNATFNLATAAKIIRQAFWFDPDLKLYIYVHGFTDDPSKQGFQVMSDAFLSQGNVNILALDASSLIKWLYLRSSTYVQYIGDALGQLIAYLVKVGLNPSSIHLIGHSLGAHICGYTGQTFTNITGQKIGRISGLDPAGPCFGGLSEEQTLSPEDAVFVDVIHTDAGVFGINIPLGHVDFYPNGGSEQPKCFWPTCGHSRAWEYFAESVIYPTSLLAVSCGNWDNFRKGNCDYNDTSYMGFGCKPGTRGLYTLQTADASPFGLYEDGIRYNNNVGFIKNTMQLFG